MFTLIFAYLVSKGKLVPQALVFGACVDMIIMILCPLFFLNHD